MMTADNGVRTEWQSYLANLAMVKGHGLEKYWTDSEVYRCRGGNQQLARKLQEAIGAAEGAALDAGGCDLGCRRERPRPAGQRQDARSRRCDPDGAAVGVEQDCVRPAAAARLCAADGLERQGPHRPAGIASGERAEACARPAVGRPGQPDVGCAPTASAAPGRRWWRSPAAPTWTRPRVAGGAAVRELPRRALQGLHGHPAELRPRPLHGLAVRRLGQARRTRSRRRDRSPRSARCCGPTRRACTSPGEYTSYAFMGFMEGALHSGALVARRIAERDGVKVA